MSWGSATVHVHKRVSGINLSAFVSSAIDTSGYVTANLSGRADTAAAAAPLVGTLQQLEQAAGGDLLRTSGEKGLAAGAATTQVD